MLTRSRSNSHTFQLEKLEYYYKLVSNTILEFQNPVTGLLPASLFRGKFKLDGADCSDAWVRDNVYSILAVWGLSMAYRKHADADDDRAKAYELEQRVVKLMRGLLMAMMSQVGKVERFKKTQLKEDSLHAKFNISTGSTVVGDHGWGHLQLDASALYLLMIAEMTAAGLQIIYTYDEVSFIQNLVFYIEASYRVPDYGIWERGDKTNHGLPELNTSSIGMAKAALEAISEFDLFGAHGGARSTIHVQPDQIQNCKAVLESMLPKESNSKEIGASLLSVISYPAFAVEDTTLVNLTKSEIIERLEGKYGCCRFLRDGHKTPREDPNRLHYDAAELRIFEHIECEWPLFFILLFLDGLFNDNREQADEYRNKLEPLLVKTQDNLLLVPELYYVPADKVELEYENPHSQERCCGNHVPHLWSQSLYILACLLHDGYIAVGELDPLNRRYATAPRPDLVVQVSLLVEDEEIKELLTANDIPAQTQEEAYPIRVLPAKCLGRIYGRLGRCEKLGLTGRPMQHIGLVGTGSLYRADETILAFTPQFLDYQQFYLCLDNELLIDAFKNEIDYLKSNWRMLGRPTLTIPITHAILDDSMSSPVGKFLLRIKSGYLYGVRVRVGYLKDLLSTSCIQKLDFVKPPELEELVQKYPDPILSPRSSDLLKSGEDEDDDFTRSRRGTICEPFSGGGSSSSISRQQLNKKPSWGPDDDMDSGLYTLHNVSWSISHSKPAVPQGEVDVDELRRQLEKSDSIVEQANILHHLYSTRGHRFEVQLHGIEGCTVYTLLTELYEKGSRLKMWSLIRHTAGMLGKMVDNLGETANDLLVRQKQLSVGLPHMSSEEVITRPLPPKEIKRMIYKSSGENSSTAVLTQELLVYLSMFVKTEPALFKEMLRLRVGLIMEVMAAEFSRTSGYLGEEAATHFMNLSPFQMKSLLYHILSGKEFGVRQGFQNSFIVGIEGKGSISRVKKAVRRMSMYNPQRDEDLSDASSQEESKQTGDYFEGTRPKVGKWMRRRCLDGALNRVPVDFYPKIWRILEKCDGILVAGQVMPHLMVQEMTPGEMKFALCVESALNRIPFPEYRQLMVEALMILSLVIENENKHIHQVINIDDILRDANLLFIRQQGEDQGDAALCCAKTSDGKSNCGANNNICLHFYDSAPSGAYGTMTYFAQAILKTVLADVLKPADMCKVN